MDLRNKIIYMLSCKPGLFFWLLTAIMLTACTPSSTHVKPRYFWPLPIQGVEPKIEYLGFFQTDADLYVKTNKAWLTRNVLGRLPPAALFASPFWVELLPEQKIVVTDSSLRQVIILDTLNEKIRVLKNNAGKSYVFSLPMGVAAAENGDLYVVDSLKTQIVKFDANETFIDAFPQKRILEHPVGIAINNRDGLVYVTDVGQHNITVFDLQGNLLYTIGSRGTQEVQFNFPTDIDIDTEGNIYVLDTMNYRVQVLDAAGRFVRQFGEQGTESGSFRMPKGLAVSPHGQVYVTDVLSHKVLVFDQMGRYLLSLGGKHYALESHEVTPGGFFAPRGVATDAEGRLLVVDGLNKMIHRFQYLTKDYLKIHPILEGEVYLPPDLRSLQ